LQDLTLERPSKWNHEEHAIKQTLCGNWGSREM